MTTDRDDDGEHADRRETVRCLACGGIHLVDPADAPKPPEDPE